MSRFRMTIIAFLSCSFLSCALLSQPGAGQPPQRPDLAQAVQQIIDQTNDFRRDEKLPPVKSNDKLTTTAQSFADFMARTDKYGHEADGQTPAERAQKQGYEYCLVAENIAYVFRSTGFATDELSRQFVEGWKDSPEHRQNMLDADMTETGVAIAHSEESGNYYAVQLFGRPKSEAIEFRLTNRAGVAVEYTVGDQSHTLPPRSVMAHQMCRPSDVTFQWPDAAGGGSQKIRPSQGERFAIVAGDGGKLSVKKES